MLKEIILLLIFLFVVILVLQTTLQSSLPKESAIINKQPVTFDKKNDKKHVNFAEFRTERVFNKNTGSIITERISNT